MKLTKGLTFPFAAFSFASLMVFLGGLAALQSVCWSPGGVSTTPNMAFGVSDTNICSKVFRFHWFTFAFVCVTLLSIMIVAASLRGLHSSRPFWIGMLAISTLLMMLMCETFLGNSWDVKAASNALRAVTAGAIMTVIGLVLLMMAVGTDWEHRTGSHHDVVTKPESGVTHTSGVAVPVQNVRVAENV